MHLLKRYSIIITTIIITLCIYTQSSAQYTDIFTLPVPQQYSAVNKALHAGEDSATDMRNANLLMQQALATNNETAILNAKRALLSLKQLWHVAYNELPKELKALEREAQKANSIAVVTYVYEIYGNYYLTSGNYPLAFQYYLRAFNNYHNLYPEQFPDMSASYYSLASSYYKFGDYENALKYSSAIANRKFEQEGWLKILLNDMCGTCCLKLKKYDSALAYFDTVEAIAYTFHNDVGRKAWQGIATGKKGIVYAQVGNYEKAITHLKKGIDICLATSPDDNVAVFATQLVNIYINKNNLEEAGKYLNTAWQIIPNCIDISTKVSLYKSAAKYYERLGNANLAIRLYDTCNRLRDSAEILTDKNIMFQSEMKAAEELKQLREEIAYKEQRSEKIMRNSLIGIVILLMIVTLLFYNRKLLKQENREQQLAAEKLIAERELQTATQLIENYKRNIDEKNILLSQLQVQEQKTDSAETIDKLQKSTILTDEQWEEFKSLFNKIHPDFLHQLKNKLPGLSPAEVRFLVLAKLAYNTKEMAAALGVTTQAIRTTWYRLRKKLNLPEEGSIEELINEIS